jgi:hypothetical protein
VLLVSIVLLTAIAAFGVHERRRWLRDADALCEAAAPLVQNRAPREAILYTIGSPSGEYGSAKVTSLIDKFGVSSEKGRDLASNLKAQSRLLLYSRSNSVMFVYVDGQSHAVRAQCFLQ